jgi:hypothetical protein
MGQARGVCPSFSATGLSALETKLDFIHLLVSPRRDAAKEYVKSTWKADFTYFPRPENKARFGDYFSKSKWIKSSIVSRVLSTVPV